MSKYKVGDKVVLVGEITDVKYHEKTGEYRCDIDFPNECDGLCYVCEDKLQSYESFLEQHCKPSYEDGLADAWGAARKIYCNESEGGLPKADMNAIFGNGWHVADILKSTPQETIAKIKEWEDSKEIRRGDVVIDDTGEPALVIRDHVGKDRTKCYLVFPDLSCGIHEKEEFTKTDRNIADKLTALVNVIGGTDDVEKI